MCCLRVCSRRDVSPSRICVCVCHVCGVVDPILPVSGRRDESRAAFPRLSHGFPKQRNLTTHSTGSGILRSGKVQSCCRAVAQPRPFLCPFRKECSGNRRAAEMPRCLSQTGRESHRAEVSGSQISCLHRLRHDWPVGRVSFGTVLSIERIRAGWLRMSCGLATLQKVIRSKRLPDGCA